MAMGAVLAAALTDHSAHPFGLYINGADVIKEPGAPGNRFGVAVESIEVVEAGPGATSSMSFVITDPLKAITLVDGAEVRFYDFRRDVPLFGGYLSSWSPAPDYGDQGRSIAVDCDGWDIWLDWIKVPAETHLTGEHVGAAIQSVAQATPLRTNAASLWQEGDRAGPVGNFPVGYTLPVDVAIAGQTLREAIRLLGEAVIYQGNDGINRPLDLQVSVDWYGGLRVWAQFYPGNLIAPHDWTTLMISDTIAGATAADNLKHTNDASTVVRSVYIKGGNFAGTGLVSDGTGKPGAMAYLEDATILTAGQRDARGRGYLDTFAASYRGSFTLADYDPGASDVHAGAGLTIADDEAVGPAPLTTRIMEIRKTWQRSGREDWTVRYGALAGSFVRDVRRWTRGVLS